MNVTAPVPPAPPAPPSFRLAALFKFRPAGRRWPFAARAAICMGVPVVVGWVAGDLSAGLMATIGAFTALYGSDRPYRNRAGHLAAVAASFTIAVTLGIAAAELPFATVPTVVMIAMVATFLCNAFRVGPPGAYMFALACAAGTAMPVGHLILIEMSLLVLAGGSFAWLMHMAGALIFPRGPERAAVLDAARAIEHFAEAMGTPAEDTARHKAALAMHNSWTALVTHQPAHPSPDGALGALRAINRELNLVFVSILNSNGTGGTPLSDLADKARLLADRARDSRRKVGVTDTAYFPLGHLGLWEALQENLRPWSPPLLAAARVGIATALAGTVGAALDLDRAYWTMAAAVLILHQGFGWTRSLQRGIERMSGTLVGLILAGAILAIHPQGIWLALTLMLVQFIIEMTVVRNYALAVMFITAAALTIASGGHPVADVGHMLWVRGADTMIGCIIGLGVLALTTPRGATTQIPQELVRTLAAIKVMLRFVAGGEVVTVAARQARRDVQHRTFVLLQTYDSGVDAMTRPKRCRFPTGSW